jgi:hypothetical protein
MLAFAEPPDGAQWIAAFDGRNQPALLQRDDRIASRGWALSLGPQSIDAE